MAFTKKFAKFFQKQFGIFNQQYLSSNRVENALNKSIPIQLQNISDNNFSGYNDIEDVMEEVSTVALAKLDLPFTTAYMAASTETSVPVTFTNDHRRLEDIPEVDTSQEE